jgi:hypothetical protein
MASPAHSVPTESKPKPGSLHLIAAHLQKNEPVASEYQKTQIEIAQNTRSVARVVAGFCLAAAASLIWAGWGPHLEHQALLGIGGIASLVAAFYGRVSEETSLRIGWGVTVAVCFYEAIMSYTIGDRLVFVALGGISAILLAAHLLTEEYHKLAPAVCFVTFSFWCGGWCLFLFNAPSTFHPDWWDATLQGFFSTLGAFIKFVIGLVFIVGFAGLWLARLFGNNPASFTPHHRNSSTPMPQGPMQRPALDNILD